MNVKDHPVPQDVTGFQFKLVGDMTLKQFCYLGVGAFFAWLFWSFPTYWFIKGPFSVFSAIAGVAFAFLPINDRPLEIWVKNFFASIYKPTYLIWKRDSEESLTASPLFSVPKSNSSSPDFFSSIKASSSNINTTPTSTSTNNPNQVDTPATQAHTSNGISVDALLQQREQNERERLKIKDPIEENQSSDTLANVTLDIDKLEQLRRKAQREMQKAQTAQTMQEQEEQLETLITDSQEMTQEIVNLGTSTNEQVKSKILELAKSRDEMMAKIAQMQRTMQTLKTATSPKGTATKPVLAQSQASANIARSNNNLSLSDIPNVVGGLIKYSDASASPGAAIEGAIVLIKDSKSAPIRALKTNKIGQFVTSTPLDSGIYTIEIEKPGFSFDPITLELNGQILPMMDIIGTPSNG